MNPVLPAVETDQDTSYDIFDLVEAAGFYTVAGRRATTVIAWLQVSVCWQRRRFASKSKKAGIFQVARHTYGRKIGTVSVKSAFQSAMHFSEYACPANLLLYMIILADFYPALPVYVVYALMWCML